ncbi:hypothetical protein EPUL_005529 [Erysiphe pulchra]|uniref:Uncharacterized protein n=1 Tax=Erysiphe pulchra TaxID=225359 RepID=A0A2S4PRI4_9PEZI|nr:hypothetical protein EPUL_005529 [Erysiphe pulchra]
MNNILNIDSSIIHDNNKLLSRFKNERTKLDLIQFASSNNYSSSTYESFSQSLELSNLILKSKSIATTSIPSFGFGNKFRGMAEKLRPQFQSSLTTDESAAQDQLALDAKSSIPSSDLESLNLSSQPGIKDLLINAEGLLSRLQNAYVHRTSALNDMITSRDNLIEELEESNTRTQNLRSQLGDLANTISKKDQRIAELERELLETKSTSCYCQPLFNSFHEPQSSVPLPLLYNSIGHVRTFSENENCNNHSTIGLETENESDCESSVDDGVFSRPQSPALTNASSILIRSPYLGPVIYPSPPPSLSSSKIKIVNDNDNEKPKTPTNKSFFGFLNGRSNNKEVYLPEQNNCTICRGKDSNAAWDTVNLLQVENQSLKGRIIELEDAIDGALNAVMGYY